MAKDYVNFLAEQVLSDGNVVTYRLVARALGVHANEAKKMLFEFHRRENAKKSGSVHATYLLSGYKQASKSRQTNGDALTQNSEDVEIRSSPFPGSSMPKEAEEPESRVRSLTLVREEQLDDAKQQYQELTGMHVYSIQTSILKNLELISDANEKIYRQFITDDPLTKGKAWGMIQNPNAKRRSGARPPPPPEPSVTGPAKAKVALKSEAPFAQGPAKTSSTASSEPKQAKKDSGATTTSSRPAAVKRESSNLFKSFAKTKQPKEKPAAANEDDDIEVKTGGTDSSARGAHSMAIGSLGSGTEIKDDVHMADDDDEGDFVAPKSAATTGRKSKAERDAELRQKMFEDDDEDMPDASAKEDEVAASPEEEPEETDSQAMDVKPTEQEDEPAEQATVSNGRRRGRRRVPKKRMIKDAEGYLVSREEMVWESFSEDDVPVPKPKTSNAASSTASKKGQPAKKGQGNIMSFFGKR